MWWYLVDWNVTLEECNTDLVVAGGGHDKRVTNFIRQRKN
jgi:hypothetical protein